MFFTFSGFTMYSILSLLNFRLISYNLSNLLYTPVPFKSNQKSVDCQQRRNCCQGHANGKNDGNRGWSSGYSRI
ncbi:unnamed protein product [Meloidogyne enterolobii]|uniref:Uncharacterized protein n=1 Tax=Meloidogyne enterolobii TaxID=390850 RepID=A0ACB1AWK6_MELEN